jgi:HD-GYP domain-containing protein (c-di-GMP phosphodiesterase class II)
MSATIARVSDVDGQLERLAHRLSEEFGAPVGLIDPSNGRWLARLGAPESAFPQADADMLAALAAPAAGARLWRPAGIEEVAWLVLPVLHAGMPLNALAGFAVGHGPDQSDSPKWGPVCPERALRAWGNEVSSKLGGASASGGKVEPISSWRPTQGPNQESGTAKGPVDGGDGVILARLIRRFRIADAPQRYQQLACNALRAALGVQAVAWVPCHQSEPVVSIGDVGRLRGNHYRALIPTSPTESVRIVNTPDETPDPDVRQLLAVSADSQGTVGWLMAFNSLDGRSFTAADAELLKPAACLIATQQTNSRVYGDLKELLFGVIRALTAAIDAKDPYTCGHSERVARIAVRLAEVLGMPAAQRSDLYLMGLLHDVGKIGVDDAILKKPGPLSPDEYRQIQRHVEIGVQILTDLKKLNHLLPGVKHHHESLDGNGYPSGLAGDRIPYEARILAVADAYDAMSSTRPYRRRLTPSQIDEILEKGSGVQWDPKIVDALFACRVDLELVRQKGLGESLQVAVSGALGRP